MKLSSLLISIIFLILFSCENDKNENLECCSSITEGNYTESLSVINEFLSDLNYEETHNYGENSHLEQLENWLEKQPCIIEAKTTCFWCYYNRPSWSSLSIVLSKDSDTLILGVISSIPREAVELTEK